MPRSVSLIWRSFALVLFVASLVALWWPQAAGQAHAMILAHSDWRIPAIDVPKPAALPRERVVLSGEGVAAHAYPPLQLATALAVGAIGAPAPAPVLFMLHGMCSDPLPTCDYWSSAREQSWLLCPGGNDRCGESFDWKGDGETKAQHIDAAVDALRLEHGSYVARGEDILIGFSRGAFVARDVAYARPGRYRGLILIGAALQPDPKRLAASGIRRVVLASGEFDGASGTMRRAALLLERGGVEARFVSTGPIYHQLPADLDVIIRDAVHWIRAEG